MGHLGLTPQSVGQLGGYKVQGKDPGVAQKMIDDSLALEEAGAFSLVLECVPKQLAALISQKVNIPIIGIGAGVDCDGQVLVFHDVTGLYQGLRPKFVHQYVNARSFIEKGIKDYIEETRNNIFPQDKHSFNMSEEIVKQLK